MITKHQHSSGIGHYEANDSTKAPVKNTKNNDN